MSYAEYKKKGHIVYENNGAYSVLNYKPSCPAHTLIITKQHVADLRELNNSSMEAFIHAIPETFEAIQKIYDLDAQKIVDYYHSLIKAPPEPESLLLSERVLKHPDLRKRPVAFNWGMNNGFEAGQRERHIHIHLFPRRGGLGIATAMRNHLLVYPEKEL